MDRSRQSVVRKARGYELSVKFFNTGGRKVEDRKLVHDRPPIPSKTLSETGRNHPASMSQFFGVYCRLSFGFSWQGLMCIVGLGAIAPEATHAASNFVADLLIGSWTFF